MHEPDLVVLSHLRWGWVWQRPQHLISRLATFRRTWFVEEPVATAVDEPTLRQEQHGNVTRVWLEMPGDDWHVDFDDPRAKDYRYLLADLLGASDERVMWLYTSLALDLADDLGPRSLLVYDVMDDLASFSSASQALRDTQRRTLEAADVVFTGGRSLHRGVTDLRKDAVWLFPSGVDPDHYGQAREVHAGQRPVAGYVGVIDERLDLGLISGIADALPDWHIQMVGPVTKIDEGTLPSAENIRYLGWQSYEDLPGVMGSFDVALMPFALNEATRSISPTKTLEYLAAGLPVVSTPVPDVVTDYGHVVDIERDAAGFAATCRKALAGNTGRDEEIERLLARHSWDGIAARMQRIMSSALVTIVETSQEASA